MRSAEVVDVLRQLPVLVHAERRRRRLSVRAAAQEAGVSFATINRCERGNYGTDRGISTGCAIKLLRWIDSPLDDEGRVMPPR